MLLLKAQDFCLDENGARLLCIALYSNFYLYSRKEI